MLRLKITSQVYSLNLVDFVYDVGYPPPKKYSSGSVTDQEGGNWTITLSR